MTFNSDFQPEEVINAHANKLTALMSRNLRKLRELIRVVGQIPLPLNMPKHPDTVCSLAAQLGRTPEALLEQLQRAGLPHASTDDPVTEADKSVLLGYLKRCHGQVDDSARKKISLTRMESTPLSAAERKAVQRIARAKGVVVGSASKGAFLRYVELCLSVLDGVLEYVNEAEQRLNQAFRDYLVKLTWKTEHALRCKAVAVLASTSLANDMLACARADREASIHPAFAPPSAVI
ncbi:hypothetical protein LJR296_007685 [Cupriavidus necator]|uniref:hypothetical protein n=1 Tax=Cupriavidus necator TaxID=106590 RepID=UPI003ECD25F9